MPRGLRGSQHSDLQLMTEHTTPVIVGAFAVSSRKSPFDSAAPLNLFKEVELLFEQMVSDLNDIAKVQIRLGLAVVRTPPG